MLISGLSKTTTTKVRTRPWLILSHKYTSPKHHMLLQQQMQHTSPKDHMQHSCLPHSQLTEVTVLRMGGLTDMETKQCIRARVPDAIVHEVHVNMKNAVEKPILLRVGRWSINPRSKGNFIFSFDGNIPFNCILSYKHILLGPFQGDSQLYPSLGCTCLLIHKVPFTDNNNIPFSLKVLLKEVCTHPGLKRVHFAIAPCWLKPLEHINPPYTSIMFAFSDPDSTVTNTLLQGRVALFGKEVTIKKWINKPPLVQCLHCHVLGHSKSSKACPLSKSSVKCYICRGAHKSEEHDQKCSQKHAIAGICNCRNRCLNCHKSGHHCRDIRCPTHDLYRHKSPHNASKPKNKAKEKAPLEEPMGFTTPLLPHTAPPSLPTTELPTPDLSAVSPSSISHPQQLLLHPDKSTAVIPLP